MQQVTSMHSILENICQSQQCKAATTPKSGLFYESCSITSQADGSFLAVGGSTLLSGFAAAIISRYC